MDLPLLNMAIAFDSATAATPVVSSVLAYSHTVSGSNPLLFVGVVSATADVSPSFVSYAGNQMTQQGTTITRPGSSRRFSLWYQLATAAGANNVVVSFASAQGTINSGAVSYNGVSQVGFPDASGNGSATSSSILGVLTTVADNSWMVMATTQDNVDVTSSMIGTGTTMRVGGNPPGEGIGIVDSGGPISPAGANTLTINPGQEVSWAMQMDSFAPAAGGATLPTKALLGVGI